jgi:hypothetical protein
MTTTTIPVALISAARSLIGKVAWSQCANDPVQDADRRDADLHDRQELGRIVMQVHRMAGTRIARFDHHLKTRLSARGERHFRHCEQRVDEDQKEQ